MRYLITSTRSDTQITLGYDARGFLCEVQVQEAIDLNAVEWIFCNIPFIEEGVLKSFGKDHLNITILNVEFDDFWRKYAYKEGKKDAMKAWAGMSEAKRQLAFNYVQKYRDKTFRDRKPLMHPATYLRAERWLDNL